MAGRQVVQLQHGERIDALMPLAAELVATGGADGTVRIWDLATGSLLRVITDRKLIGVSNDGRRVAVARMSSLLGMPVQEPGEWRDVNSGKAAAFELAAFAPVSGTGPIRRIRLRDDGGWIALDEAGTEIAKLSPPGPEASPWGFWSQGDWLVGQVRHSVAPDIATAADEGPLVVWRRGQLDWHLLPLDGELRGVDPTGRWAVFQRFSPNHSDDALELRALDLRTERRDAAQTLGELIERGPSARVDHVAFAPDGHAVAVTGHGALSVYRLADRTLAWRRNAREVTDTTPDDRLETFEEPAWTADGRLVAARTPAGLYAFDAASGHPRGALGAQPRDPHHAGRRQQILRFDGNDVLFVQTGRRLQRWSLGDGSLAASSYVPVFDDGMDGDYAEGFVPVPGGTMRILLRDGLTLEGREREIAAPASISDPCPQGYALAIEMLRGLEPLAPRLKLEIPTRLEFPPAPGARTAACSPLGFPYGRSGELDRKLDRGRFLATTAEDAAAILDLGTGAITPLEGGGVIRDTQWEASGTLISGHVLESRGAATGPATVWDAAGKRLWQAPRGEIVAVAPDGRRAAYLSVSWLPHQVERGELVIVALPDGAELSRVVVPGASEMPSDFGRLGVWRGRDEVLWVTRDGLVSVASDQVRRVGGGGSPIYQVVASPDGTRLATVSADGALRVWGAERLALLASLAEFEDGEWLAFTPGGAFTGSPEAAERVAWVFDDGPTPEAFRFEQFAKTHRRPDLVARRLAGEDVDAPPLRRPPTARISAGPATNGVATVAIDATSRGRVDTVRLYVEGREAGERAVCAHTAQVAIDAPLLGGSNRLTAVAFDTDGLASNPAQIELASPGGERPDLWIVSVGVGRYPKLPAEAQLAAPGDDARAVVAAFEAQAGPGKTYARIHATTLVDEAATVASVDAALAGLAKMAPRDVALVFLAGHGAKPQADDMVFLTSAVESAAPAELKRAGIGWRQLGERLGSLPGRALVLLDACHAGHLTRELVVPNDATARALGGRGGVVVFAAAKGRQPSFEPGNTRSLRLVDRDPAVASVLGEGNHGLFTAAILASLGSRQTDRDGDGAIELGELIDEVTWRVSRDTHGAQTPWVARREMFGDFAVASPPK